VTVTWYELLLFVHLSAAVIWLGGGFMFQVYGAVVRRGGDKAELAQFAGRAGVLGERMFVPASLIVVLTGVGLMLEGNWEWEQLWVVFGLIAFAASFFNGLLLISPTAKKVPVVGPTTPEGQVLIVRLFVILRTELAVLFTIVLAMTAKPTGDDVWLIVIVVAVLAVLIAAFVAPLRSSSATASDR
jgi:uncharacterized membrane protein